MGIFGKLFGALKKTKENFSSKLRVLFSKNKLGDEFYEELEEILISSDVSVTTAEEVVARVKEKAIERELLNQMKELLDKTVGKTISVLVEQPLEGTSENYLKVRFETPQAVGQIIDVVITKRENDGLVG